MNTCAHRLMATAPPVPTVLIPRRPAQHQPGLADDHACSRALRLEARALRSEETEVPTDQTGAEGEADAESPGDNGDQDGSSSSGSGSHPYQYPTSDYEEESFHEEDWINHEEEEDEDEGHHQSPPVVAVHDPDADAAIAAALEHHINTSVLLNGVGLDGHPPTDVGLPDRHPYLGTTLHFPPELASFEYMGPQSDKSLMRLYDYTDAYSVPRTFLDGILKMVGHEIDHHGFNPSVAPSRKTFVSRCSKLYPLKPPVCVQIPLENSAGDPLAISTPDDFRRGKRDVASVIKFDFEDMLRDLLEDNDIFGDIRNLMVNQSADKRFHPYQNLSGHIDDIMEASWYKDTIALMKSLGMDIENEFVIVLVLYMDKTGTDRFQRYGLEPLLFTIALIRRFMRQHHRCHRILGFIPDLDLKSSAVKQAARSTKEGKGSSTRNYHRCLHVLLKQIAVADEKGITTWLRLGDRVKQVRLRFRVSFAVGDGKSGDTLCCRYGGHKGSCRLCRACTVSYNKADDPSHICKYLSMNEINQLVVNAMDCRALATQDKIDKAKVHKKGTRKKGMNPEEKKVHRQATKEAEEALQAISTHVCVNSFRDIPFGANPQGIHGATPVDLMHCYLLGIIRYCMRLAVHTLSPVDRAALDRLVDVIFGYLRTSEGSNFLRTSFSKGFTNLTQITAEEWPGMLMTILMLVRVSGKARNIMKKVFSSLVDLDVDPALWEPKEDCSQPPNQAGAEDALVENDDYDFFDTDQDVIEEMVKPCSLNDFIQLSEALLSFHAWYKLGHPFPWSAGEEESVGLSVRKLLAMLVTYLPRKTGNGWKIQKFHDLLHLSNDMGKFGSPLNFDAGPYESSLRFWAKRMAQTAQMRGYTTFAKQVGARTHEYFYMAKTRRAMGMTGVSDKLATIPEEEEREGTNSHDRVLVEPRAVFHVITDPDTDLVSCPWVAGNESTRHGLVEVHPAVVNYFRGALFDADDEAAPKFGFTHLKYHGLSYRAHPNYQNRGEWYDWAMVPFGEEPDLDQDERETSYPANCVPCKILCFLDETADADGSTSKALVHACEFRDDTTADSCMAETWEMEYSKADRTGYRRAVIRCVDTASLLGRLLVIEETPGAREGFFHTADTEGCPWVSPSVLLVTPRISWAKTFH